MSANAELGALEGIDDRVLLIMRVLQNYLDQHQRACKLLTKAWMVSARTNLIDQPYPTHYLPSKSPIPRTNVSVSFDSHTMSRQHGTSVAIKLNRDSRCNGLGDGTATRQAYDACMDSIIESVNTRLYLEQLLAQHLSYPPATQSKGIAKSCTQIENKP